MGAEGGGIGPTTGAGSGSTTVVKTTWEQLIEQLNGLFQGELTDADLVSYARTISEKMLEDPVLAQQAATNSKETFLHGDFNKSMMSAVITSRTNHTLMSKQVLERKEVQEGLASILLDLVYEGFKKKREKED